MSLQRLTLNPTQFLQRDAHFPYRAQLAPHFLPVKIRTFFSQCPLSKDFHPFHARYENPIHVGLKKLCDVFEHFWNNRTLDERIKTAEAIVQDIRNAVPVLAPLFELAARYHLTYRLLKMQSELPQIQVSDIGKIYNFMTVKNSFILPEEFRSLVLRQNLIPRIASNAADLWKLKSSLTKNLTKAEEHISYYVKGLKKIISHPYLEEQDWYKPPADNEGIDSLFACLDTALRNTFSQKLIMHTSKTCKASYAQTGTLPKDIATTIEKITGFLNHSDEKTRTLLAVPCDPAKDLLSQVFDTRKSLTTQRREIEREAREKHAQIDQRLLNRIFPCLSSRAHAKIHRMKNNKLDAVAWAEKQYYSAKPICYPLAEPILVEDAFLFSDFAPSRLDSPKAPPPDFLTS